MKKIVKVLLLLVVAMSNLTGVKAEEKTTIKIGVTSVSNITYEAIKPVYEAMGYQTEVKMFDTNPVLLEALASGEIDMSLGQHKIFVENFSKTKGTSIEVVKPYDTIPELVFIPTNSSQLMRYQTAQPSQ